MSFGSEFFKAVPTYCINPDAVIRLIKAVSCAVQIKNTSVFNFLEFHLG